MLKGQCANTATDPASSRAVLQRSDYKAPTQSESAIICCTRRSGLSKGTIINCEHMFNNLIRNLSRLKRVSCQKAR